MKRNDEKKRMVLFEIKAGALLLQHNMSSHLLGEALCAQMEYERLVEQFYSEYRQWCSEEDYKNAVRDFDAFMRLLNAAIERMGQASDDSGKS